MDNLYCCQYNIIAAFPQNRQKMFTDAKTPGEEDGRLCFCFVSKRLTVPNFSPSYDINFKVEFLSTNCTKLLEILNDCFIWPNLERILMNFIAEVSEYQDDLMRLVVLIFSTGYVIDFKV